MGHNIFATRSSNPLLADPTAQTYINAPVILRVKEVSKTLAAIAREKISGIAMLHSLLLKSIDIIFRLICPLCETTAYKLNS